MNQSERRRMLIQSLLKEDPAYRDIRIPAAAARAAECACAAAR